MHLRGLALILLQSQERHGYPDNDSVSRSPVAMILVGEEEKG